MPSARSRMRSRRSSGSPGTSPPRSELIAAGGNGSRCSEAKLRLPAPQPGRFSANSGSRERQDEERVAARPLDEVLEEVEQPLVSPLHVFEDEHDRRLFGEPLEQDAPGGEEVLLVSGRAIFEPEQVGKAGLDPLALALVPDFLSDHRAELL